MGQEVRCGASYEEAVHEGRCLLETDELVFRGDPPAKLRLKIPFKEIDLLEAVDGQLHVTWTGESAVFELGKYAEKWVDKIRNPKSLIDKLDVKPGMRVAVLGVDDAAFITDLRARAHVVVGEVPEGANVVFLGVEAQDDMKRMGELKNLIARDGAVWVVYRKGRKDFHENDVLRLGLESGLVDVKVARFSETHSASKFVIRKAER